MDMYFKIATTIGLFLIPIIFIRLNSRFMIIRNLGPVTLCYITGFLISVMPIPISSEYISSIYSVIVVISIPLILYGFDLTAIRKISGSISGSFLLMLASVAMVGFSLPLLAGKLGIEYGNELASMAAGLYTGGTPNLIAIGKAVTSGQEGNLIIAAAGTADIIFGGLYFVLIITVMPRVYRKFLGSGSIEQKSVSKVNSDDYYRQEAEFGLYNLNMTRREYIKLAAMIALSVCFVGIGAVLEILINGSLQGSMYIIITVSLAGIICSFIEPVRQVKGTYQFGQYLVCVFVTGLAMSIDLSNFASGILPVLVFFAIAQTACCTIHLVLCRIFRIDGYIALITSTAGIYGPPFIAPAASVCKAGQLIAPGILCGVFGLAIGNVFGIGLYQLLEVIS